MLRCLGERINLRFSITYFPFSSSTLPAHLINNHLHVSHLHMSIATVVDDSFATKRDELVDKVLVVSLPWRVEVDGQRNLLLGKFGRDRKDVGDIASTERSSYLRNTVTTRERPMSRVATPWPHGFVHLVLTPVILLTEAKDWVDSLNRMYILQGMS